MLGPDTTRRLLDRIVTVPGVRRILLNGQNLPLVVPYGPARGLENAHRDRKRIRVLGNEVDLRVQVGTVTLEVEDSSVLDEVRSLCDEFFVDFSCQVQEGKFMKTTPTLADYAKYGPSPDMSLVGLSDPKRKDTPVVLKQPAGCRGDL
jgi:methyl-coenzyme M reductase subunit D